MTGPLFVLNADDLGLNEAVNRSILAATPFGLLRSVSVMVGMPAVEHAMDELSLLREKDPSLVPGLGLHFCLTSGKCLSSPERIPLLAGPDGLFRNGFLSLLRLILSTGTRTTALHQIAIELHSQYHFFRSRLRERGLTDDHLDSHQHIHAMPGIGPLLQRLAIRRKLVLRIPRERFGALTRLIRTGVRRFPGGPAKKIILDSLLASWWRNEGSTPGYFGILDSGHMNQISIKAIFRTGNFLRRAPFPVWEINLHPWQVDPKEFESSVYSAGDRTFASSSERAAEWQGLVHPEYYNELIEKFQLRFGTFASAPPFTGMS